MRERVSILQEYVPHYRKPLFDRLARLADDDGIDLQVFAGTPSRRLRERHDAVVAAPWLRRLRQHEIRIGHRRLTLRVLPRTVLRSRLIVLEQARRNADAYMLLAIPSLAKKVAMWGHGSDVVKRSTPLERRIGAALTRRVRWFFAYTPRGASTVIAGGFDPDRVTVLLNSIDVEALASDLSSVLAAGAQGAEPVAAYVGALDRPKRIGDLLETARIIHEAEPRFRLVICGDGEDRDMVERAAREWSFVEYVGTVSGRQKAEVLASCALLLNPGRVGLSAVDSLVAGRPIVTLSISDHGPEIEYLEHDETCLIVDGGVPQLAEAAVGLFGHPDRLSMMQEACRAESRRYSVEAMADRFWGGITTAMGRRDGATTCDHGES